ncbi:uncharacterized protein [Aegilops tauschii subsp. strangulata]|uniref:uncharacterized protein n=1 Tax=Aegilops tauschii subsp. strangulata TaxID=200361 RepID=UPI003CC8DE1F
MEIANHNIIVWNVRGLNIAARGAAMRSLVDDASVVCLLESKLERVDQRVIHSLLGLKFGAFVALPTHGTAGGIIVAWDSTVAMVPAFRIDQFYVMVEMVFGEGNQWTLTAVYGPTDDTLKPLFLDELRAIRAACAGPWAVAGDFNLIVEAADKSNNMINRRMMGSFRCFLNDMELKEAYWDTGHPGHLLQALSSSISDHCPLLMSTNVSFHRKSRFHFQSYWPSLPGFHDVVAGSWNSLPPKANPFVDLFLRLKATAKALTRWNQAKVGNIKEQMLLANELILCFDQAMDSRPLSSGETWLRKQLKKKVLGLASLQRTIARQKLRISWPKAGEASEAFFKIFASQRRRKNHIFRLKSGAAEATSRAGMCEMAGDYYAGLLGRPVLRQHTLRLAALELPAVDTATLETPLSETLIWNTVKDM